MCWFTLQKCDKKEAGASISTTLCNFGHWPANGKHCIAFQHSDSLTCNYFHITSLSHSLLWSRSPLTSPGIQPCVSNALMLHSHCHRIPLHCTSLQNNCALYYCPFLMSAESIWDEEAKASTDDHFSSFLCYRGLKGSAKSEVATLQTINDLTTIRPRFFS